MPLLPQAAHLLQAARCECCVLMLLRQLEGHCACLGLRLSCLLLLLLELLLALHQTVSGEQPSQAVGD